MPEREDPLVTAQARIAQLEAALAHLANEVDGILLWSDDLRQLIGNTNRAVLILRLKGARATLKAGGTDA